jgi:hypothetical protein
VQVQVQVQAPVRVQALEPVRAPADRLP